MWILRSRTENVNVTCIPVKEEFTIGRIGNDKEEKRRKKVIYYIPLGCNFNIVEDKSVSRLHALIHFNQSKPILTDPQSKFGTLVNGEMVERGKTGGKIICSGDTIKFGGAGSEFM